MKFKSKWDYTKIWWTGKSWQSNWLLKETNTEDMWKDYPGTHPFKEMLIPEDNANTLRFLD